MLKTRLIILTGVIIIFGLILVSTSFFIKKNDKSDGYAQSAFSVNLDLTLSRPPPINQNTEIVMKVNYVGDFLEERPFVVDINLPEGIELISGNLKWEGNLEQDLTSAIIIRPTETGNLTIKGTLRSPPTGESYRDDQTFIYLMVMENETVISEKAFPRSDSCKEGQNCTFSEPK